MSVLEGSTWDQYVNLITHLTRGNKSEYNKIVYEKIHYHKLIYGTTTCAFLFRAWQLLVSFTFTEWKKGSLDILPNVFIHQSYIPVLSFQYSCGLAVDSTERLLMVWSVLRAVLVLIAQRSGGTDESEQWSEIIKNRTGHQ